MALVAMDRHCSYKTHAKETEIYGRSELPVLECRKIKMEVKCVCLRYFCFPTDGSLTHIHSGLMTNSRFDLSMKIYNSFFFPLSNMI